MDNEFYKKLEQLLTSDAFIRSMSNFQSSEQRKKFLIRSLNYIISTRDIDSFEYYITHFHKLFPEEYLLKKGMSKSEVDALIYDNYIKNGFLFHTSPSYNDSQIMNEGLLSLNDRTNIDLYQKCQNINQIYDSIKKRNSGAFTLSSLITVPGEVDLCEERFTSVYLSSNLEYILNTYGYKGEFADYFVRNVFWAFNSKVRYQDMSKEELYKEILGVLESDDLKIKDEEIDEILGFFNLIYREKSKEENNGQSIVLVPTRKIVSSPKFDFLYRKNKLGLSVPMLIDFDKGEVINKGSIHPEDIAIISPDENKKLRLIKK